MKQPLQIHRARSTKNQGFIEFKCGDQMIHGQNTNLVLGQCGKQFVVPTLVLLPDEKLHRRRDPFQLLGWSQAVRAHVSRTMFNFLQEA